MTVINTNTASINAQYNLSKVNKEMESAMEALSSGKRINSAADDAAGLSIATRMESQVRGLNQAMTNAADGQNMIATAEGAMDEITNMLQRMRELSLQAASDTMNTQDRENLNNEITQLKTEIDRVVENTRYNDQILLDGTQQGTTFQIGAKSGESLSFNIADMSTSALGSSSSALNGVGSVSATAQGEAAVDNIVNLTFNGNDTYGFKIKLAGDANQEVTISGAKVEDGSAQAVAAAINSAVAATSASDYSGTDISGLVTASASGTTVTLNNKAGTKIDFSSFTSAGAGTMTMNPVTNTTAASKTLENDDQLQSLANTGGTTATEAKSSLQFEGAKAFKFRVNDTLISFDTTTAGMARDGHANAAAAVTAAVADIKAAIEATSDGTITVSGSTVSGTPDKHVFKMTDASGADIDISGFQKVTSSKVEDGFMSVTTDISAAAPTIEVIENGEYFTAGQKDVATDSDTALLVDANKSGRIQFSNQDLKYTFKIDWAHTDSVDATATTSTVYTVDGATKDFTAELARVAEAISADGGNLVAASNQGGVLEIVNNSAAKIVFDGDYQVTSPGVDAVAEGDAYFLSTGFDADGTPDGIADETGAVALVDGSIVSSTNNKLAEASVMSMSFSANDRYTFNIDKDGTGTDADVKVSADVLNGDLTGVMNQVNSYSSTSGIIASIDGSQLMLTKADGSKFSVHSFASDAGGQISAANAAGQGASTVLQAAGAGDTGSVAASGAAVATEMELTFSAAAADKYSFKISDGSATATVRATSTAVADDTGSASATLVDTAADVDDILKEIQNALKAANMSHMSAAAATDGTITLTNKLGGKVDITDFKSDGTGTMTASPKVAAATGSTDAIYQGTSKILNDDALAGSYDSIAAVDALSSSTATLAVEAVDRALENINSARSELGALSNRLDHTISNLGNIVVNTEASQSRIEDADFAATTGELTKAQIMSQAATAMLAQANASKQGVLSLLQG